MVVDKRSKENKKYGKKSNMNLFSYTLLKSALKLHYGNIHIGMLIFGLGKKYC